MTMSTLRLLLCGLVCASTLTGCLTINNLNIVADRPDGTPARVAIVDAARLSDLDTVTRPLAGSGEATDAQRSGKPTIVIIGTVSDQ
jgi:hypothetical protein